MPSVIIAFYNGIIPHAEGRHGAALAVDHKALNKDTVEREALFSEAAQRATSELTE